MDLENLKNNPLALLVDVQNVFNRLRKEVDKNNNYVRIIHDSEGRIVIEDIDYQSNFSFTIENPRLDKEVKYDIIFSPTSNANLNLKKHPGVSTPDRIISVFNVWLKTITYYQNINIHPNHKVIKNYQEQFYNSIEFIDNEGDDSPLSFQAQKQLSDFLVLMINEYDKDDNVDDKLIDELIELNKCIPQLTQGQIKSKLSWVFAKFQYLGIDAINRIMKVSTDAGISFLFFEGVKKMLGM